MASREKRTSMASPNNMPAPPVPRRSDRAGTPRPRAGTPMPRAGTPMPRAGTPMPNHRASTPVPRGQRASTPMLNQRGNNSPNLRGLKTVETQTPTMSRRPSLHLQLPSQRKSFSPYDIRSESPAGVLRNGKQQRSRISGLFLDDIPVKRTRSLMSVDGDASPSGVFNDTASIDGGFFNFLLPDSPLDTKSNSFLSPDSLSITSTPRRRVRRLSETSNVSTMSTRSLSLPNKKKSGVLPPESPKAATQTKRVAKKAQENKLQTKADAKTGKVVEGKRKRKADDPSAPGPAAKKIKKNAVVKEKSSKLKVSKVVKKTKAAAKSTKAQNKKAVTKTKKMPVKEAVKSKVVAKKNQKVTKQQLAQKISKNAKGGNIRTDSKNKNVMLKHAKNVVVKKKLKVEVPEGKKRKVLAENINSRGKGLRKGSKNEIKPESAEVGEKQTSVSNVSNKKPVIKRNEPPVLKKNEPLAVKKDEPEEPKMQDAATETIRKTKNLNIKNRTSNLLSLKTIKKPVAKKVTKTGAAKPDMTLKTLTEVSKILEKIAETKSASQESDDEIDHAVRTPPLAVTPKTKCTVPAAMDAHKAFHSTVASADTSRASTLFDALRSSTKPPTDSVRTATSQTDISRPVISQADISRSAVSQADTPKSATSQADSSLPDISHNDTLPLEASPSDTSQSDVSLQDASHVSPINTLANKLRHKLAQTPTAPTNPEPPQISPVNGTAHLATAPQNVRNVSRAEMSRVSRAMKSVPSATAAPITPLPIINSLSAAAKQTSSFLRQVDETELPTVTKKDSQYKINQTIIYNKMKHEGIPHNLLNNSMKTSVSNIFNRKGSSVLMENRNLAVKALFTDSRAANVPQNKVVEAEVVRQNGDVPVGKPEELDNNENKLDAKVDQVADKANNISENNLVELEVGADSNIQNDKQVLNSSKSPIPEKDKISDNHSKSSPSAATALLTVTESNLNSDKTDKNDKPSSSTSVQPDVEDSSDGSFKTPECTSPATVLPEPVETQPPKESAPSMEFTESKDQSKIPESEAKAQPATAAATEETVDSTASDKSAAVTTSPVATDVVTTTTDAATIATDVATTVATDTATIATDSLTASNDIPANDIFSIIPPSLLNPDPTKRPTLPFEEEDLVAKESVLGALGLRSNQSLSEEAKAPKVPKLRLVCRPAHKKHRRSANHDSLTSGGYKEKTYAVCREGDPYVDWDRTSPSKSNRELDAESDTRSLLWYPRMPISNGQAADAVVDSNAPEPGVGVGDGLGQDGTEGGEKSSEPLVIPEKSSSFAIHPGRLCEDVCCYCHNKFGLYDTPLHVAQLKGDEKQQTVLTREPLLSLESCLCDACFRHLDRPGPIRGPKPPATKQKPLPNQTCCFIECYQPAAHTMMRKWKRRARSLLPEDQQDPKVTNWICENHYSELARIGACGLCHRRLSSQQMYKLEVSAVPPLNKLLRRDHVPVTLDGTMSLCKKCRYYTSLRLRTEDHTKLNSTNRIFLKEHRSRVLKALNIEPSTLPDVFAEIEKPKKQPKKKDNKAASPVEVPVTPKPPLATPQTAENSNPAPTATANKQQLKPKLRIKLNTPTRKMPTNARMSTGNSRMPPPPPPPTKNSPLIASKTAADQAKLISSSGLKLPSQTRITLQARPIAPAPLKLSSPSVQISPVLSRLAEKGEVRRVTSQNSGVNLLSRIGLTKYPSPTATITSNSQTPQVTILPVPSSRSSATKVSPRQHHLPSPPVGTQREFPSTSDVAMTSKFEFQPADESVAWQKVNATFQFDRKTRQLWHNLHAPYGSYTSFLRHLVLLENHWRNGDLILAPTASPRSRQYLNSVQNRIQAYEGVSSDQDAALGSIPLISEVRSLASGEAAESWGVTRSKV